MTKPYWGWEMVSREAKPLPEGSSERKRDPAVCGKRSCERDGGWGRKEGARSAPSHGEWNVLSARHEARV